MVSSTSRSGSRTAQASELGRNRNSAGRAGTGDQDDPAVGSRVRRARRADRPQRGQPDAAGHDHQVAAGGRREVPAGAERPAHADHGCPAGRRAGPRLTAPTARIVCASLPSAPAGSPLTEIATSPMPRRGEHHELARLERRQGAASGSSRSVTRVAGLRRAAGDPVGDRQHRLAHRRRLLGRVSAGHGDSRRGRAAAPGWPAGASSMASNRARPGRSRSAGSCLGERAQLCRVQLGGRAGFQRGGAEVPAVAAAPATTSPARRPRLGSAPRPGPGREQRCPAPTRPPRISQQPSACWPSENTRSPAANRTVLRRGRDLRPAAPAESRARTARSRR